MNTARASAPPPVAAPVPLAGAPVPLAGAAVGAPTPHLHAVDVVRLLTVLGVIVVHATSLVDPSGSVVTGGVLVVGHVTREVFLFLSALVLTLGLAARPTPSRSWWRRRYPLVVVPYMAWSAVYLLTGPDPGSPARAATTYMIDLVDGGAAFHLYFLLLTFQLYMVMPALVRALARRARLHLPLLASATVFELGFTAAVHYRWRPPILGIWLDHPGSWLVSYPLWVVGGVVVALHLREVTAWVRAHPTVVTFTSLAALAAALASYAFDLDVLGYAPNRASEVFQPAVVVLAVAAVAAQFAIGLRVADRLASRPRLRRRLEASSDVSFGVYLAHPLLIGALLDLAGAVGVDRALGGIPAGFVEVLVVLGLVPFVYAVTAAAVSLARRGPLSLALTGRRRAARPVPADGSGERDGVRA